MSVALITGCSTGFGLLTAIDLAVRGDRVFATMRNLAKADDLQARAKSAGIDVELVQLDVTDSASVSAAVDEVVKRAGVIDVVVNNAGIGIIGPMEELDDDELQRVFETNVFGAVRVTREVLPLMRANGGGHIITVSSVAGLVTPPFLGLYAASKYAVESFMESLYHEVEPFGIRVSLVEPGFFRTEIMDNSQTARRVGPTSPYFDRTMQVVAKQTEGVQNGPDPSRVASLIAEIAHDDQPRLRYPVPEEVRGMLDLRKTLTDEQFADVLRQSYGL